MRTKWDSTKPKQHEGVWIIAGVMTDEYQNSFRITVTTPISPKANRLDLGNFMKLQTNERHKKIEVVLVDTDQDNHSGNQPHAIQLGNLFVQISPIQIGDSQNYRVEVSDSIGDKRAALGSQFSYTINNTNLYVSCSVDMGTVRMSVANESRTLNGGESGQITRSSATSVLWNILFECLGPQNRFTIKMTDHLSKSIS